MSAYDAICRYALYGEEPDLSKLPDSSCSIFLAFKPNLDASRKKSESGKKGGKTAKQTESKPEANESKPEADESKPEADQNQEDDETKNKNKDKNKIKNKYKCIDESAERIMQAWNTLPLAHIEGIQKGSQREKMLSARIRDHGEEKVLAAIEEVRNSDFLMGKEKDWRASFDWLIAPTNFQKVIEGTYRTNKAPSKTANWQPGERQMDDDEIAAIRAMMQE